MFRYKDHIVAYAKGRYWVVIGGVEWSASTMTQATNLIELFCNEATASDTASLAREAYART
jgi:hypothetical protein